MTVQIVLHNNKGTTLIEILISILLTSIVFTGLVTSSTLVMNQNLDNLIRDEAVSIAEDTMSQARATPFAGLVSGPSVIVVRDFRGVTGFPFNTSITVGVIDGKNKLLTVNVTWLRKGLSLNHNIVTVVRSS